jgi:hypothetical protein
MASPAPSPRVRVEDAATSLGRSYSAPLTSRAWDGKAISVPGLGAARRALTTRSFVPRCSTPVLESASMALVNLRTATRAEVLQYFENTWALTETLFGALKTDAVFYSVPDKLRRPLIFYFGHPAALYVNKLHQAGLVGARPRPRAARRAAPTLNLPIPRRPLPSPQTTCTPSSRNSSRRASTK